MEYRKIGSSNLELSAIVFGAWAAGGWMWGGTDRREAVKAMEASYDLGVTSIDTAPVYGQGLSEEIVGEVIGNIPRDKVQILTKFGLRWDVAKGTFHFKSKDNEGRDMYLYKYSGKASVIRECEESLRRLGTDYIDLYQIHWPDNTTPIDESMEAVEELIKSGKVRYAGVCNYSAAQMEEAEETVPIISNQVPYSMVRRGIEDEVVPYCLKNSKGILAYSPLERGLLTGKMKPGQSFGEGDHRSGVHYFTDENITRTNEFLRKITPLAEQKNCTLAQLVIRWTLAQPGISVALVGARNARQATENARAAEVELTAQENDFVTSQLERLKLNSPG